MLVGEIGTGKTTLVQSLLQSGCEGVRIAYVTNPTLSFEEILRLIAGHLGFEPGRIGKLELIQSLDSFLDALGPGESAALIFDEAQDLSDQTLEELRLLSNPQGPAPKRLQIVLVGQLELARRLERPGLRQLNQRIGARALLPTLRQSEVAEYVKYRLRAHGGELARIFKREALSELARLSGGIPRRINMLCHNALMLAYAQQARRAGATHIRDAARDYDNLLAGSLDSSKDRRRGFVFKAAAAWAIGIAVLGLSYHFAAGTLGTIEGGRPKAAAIPLPVGPQAVSGHRAGAAHNGEGIVNGQQCSTFEDEKAAAVIAPDLETRQSLSTPAKVMQELAINSPPSALALPGEEKLAKAAGAPTGSAQTAPAVENPAPAISLSASLDATRVVVEPGDTLSKILLRRKGNAATGNLRRRVAMVIDSNPEIVDADHIYPGQIIRLQEASTVNSGGVSK